MRTKQCAGQRTEERLLSTELLRLSGFIISVSLLHSVRTGQETESRKERGRSGRSVTRASGFPARALGKAGAQCVRKGRGRQTGDDMNDFKQLEMYVGRLCQPSYEENRAGVQNLGTPELLPGAWPPGPPDVSQRTKLAHASQSNFTTLPWEQE